VILDLPGGAKIQQFDTKIATLLSSKTLDLVYNEIAMKVTLSFFRRGLHGIQNTEPLTSRNSPPNE